MAFQLLLNARGIVAGSLLACGVAFAQGGAPATVTMPPAPLLPLTATMIEAPAGVVPAESPEMQAILKEDGLKREAARQTLVPILHGTTSSGWIAAYEFDDATGAYAAYTYLRQGGRPVPRGLPTQFTSAAGEEVFLSGTSVVRAKINQYPESLNGLLQMVQAGLPKIGGRKGVAPLLPTLIPSKGLDPASIRYALGPAGYRAMGGVLPADDLGWDKSAEVATADYHGGRGKMTVLLYPTPQIAGDRGRALQDDINKAGPANFGTVRMRRVGPLLGITSGGLSDGQVIDMLKALKLNQQLTFDKPMPVEFHAEVRKTYTLLQEIATFCGIGVLAAVVLAIFFGGARAGIRVLQGKPAYSEPEFLRIDLREKAGANKPEDGPE